MMCVNDHRNFVGTLLFVALLVFAAGIAEAAELQIIAGPYLQYPTQTSMIVRWETNTPASSEAGCGETADKLAWFSCEDGVTFHEVTLEGLEPAGHYFYQVRSQNADGSVASEILTFQTSVATGQPFSFIMLSDTQSNPQVVSKLAEMAYAQRPQFTVLTGDLVSHGKEKELWNNHFFANMQALNGRVPLIPCLGNHDEDAHYYYDYFSLPEPEYFYSFPYGNAEFFILDSQRPTRPGSEQYAWLEKALRTSRATWKIVCFHKPPYSSDENDYGDTVKQQSIFGDPAQRPATELYEKYGVDIVWCGHIHSYERTHPIRAGKAVEKKGVVYMVTGGGGGGLEKAGPWRSPFTAKVFSGHHYCLVNVHGGTLRIESYDLDGRLFDFVQLEK